MKLEDQVCSLILAKRLKELGVKQESYFWWYLTRHYKGDFITVQRENCSFNSYDEKIASAFTVAELGEMLPERYFTQKWDCKWSGYQEISEGKKALLPVCFESFTSDTEADARAKMLIYLIESNLVKP